MGLPQIVAREEWVAARKRLLAQEKKFTRARDRLNELLRMGDDRLRRQLSG